MVVPYDGTSIQADHRPRRHLTGSLSIFSIAGRTAIMRRRIPNGGLVAIAIISCCQITPKLQLNHHADAFSPTPRNSSLNKRKANTLQQFDIDKLNTRNRRITNISPQHNSITSLQAAPIPVIAGTTSIAKRIISHGITTFMSNWKAYSLIPLIAGFVGW